MRVVLFSHSNRGRSPKTSFAPKGVPFDAQGYADLEVDEEGYRCCKELGWLVQGDENKKALLDRLEAEFVTKEHEMRALYEQLTALRKEVRDAEEEKLKKAEETSSQTSTSAEDEKVKKEMEEMEAAGKAAAAQEAAATNAAGVPVKPETAPVSVDAAGKPKKK